MNWARSSLVAPHIYFAITRELLYVGETQTHPVIRWGAHLSESGSLRKAIQRKGDPDVDYMSDILFLGFHCGAIEFDFPPIQHRIVSQAIEHEVHCVLSELGTPFRLISDTVRTAPRRFFNARYARQTAETLVAEFLNEISRLPGMV